MRNPEHQRIDFQWRHAAVRWKFANATDRGNLVLAAGGGVMPATLDAIDVGSIAWQASDDSFWMLKTTAPTWVAVGSGGGGGVANMSSVPVDFSQETTIAAGGGPPTATIDIPIATNGTTYAEIRATAVDQTSGLELAYMCIVAVKRVAGVLSFPFGSFLEQVVPEVGLTWDSTWVARSVSASNIRLTLKGDTTHVVKWRVESDFRIVPFPA